MLVLKCNKGEAVVLTVPGGVRVEVKVVRFDAGAAFLGFDAPDSVNIERSEFERGGGAPRGGGRVSD